VRLSGAKYGSDAEGRRRRNLLIKVALPIYSSNYEPKARECKSCQALVG